MSLKIHQNNLYMLFSNNQSEFEDRIDNFMDNSFTIFVRAKIFKPDILSGSRNGYIFARTGMHSGLSYFITHNNDVIVKFNYWFLNEKNERINHDLSYVLPKDLEFSYNDYALICNHESKKIEFFVNYELKDDFVYNGFEKIDYVNSIMWIGCGNMIVDNDLDKVIGTFEIDMLFGLDCQMEIDEIEEIARNYQEKYVDEKTYNGLPTLRENILKHENFKIFMDFKNHSRYKEWNMANNGNFFRKYIPQNIMF